MSKETEYRENAAATLQLAQRAATSADKGRLLKLAEAWLDLADRAKRVTRQHAIRLRRLPQRRDEIDQPPG